MKFIDNLTTITADWLNKVDQAVETVASKVDSSNPVMTSAAYVRTMDAGTVASPVANVVGRFSTGPASTNNAGAPIPGSRTRLVIENTFAPGNDAFGGRIFIDGVRTASNMDMIMGLHNVNSNPPVDTLAVRGDGTVEALRGALKGKALLDTPIQVTSDNKKVVFFGSSVCRGYGASYAPDGLAKGYAYRLMQRLIPLGFSYANVSVDGNSTVELLNRFYTDLVPQNPDIVVIGLSLANEGILSASTAAAKEAVYQQFLDNMFTLVARCRKLGYRVVVTGSYPNNGYTDTEYSYIKQLNEEMEQTDIPFVNVLGAVDDGTGKWRAGMFFDALHPNDIGHEAMSRCFSVGLFQRMPYAVAPARYNPVGKRGLEYDPSDTSAGRIGYQSPYPFGSATLMAFVRRNTGLVGARCLLSMAGAGEGDPIRVNNAVDYWALQGYGTARVDSTKYSLDMTLDHLAVTYDYYTGISNFYVNGVLAGSSQMGQRDLAWFSVGSRYDVTGTSAYGYDFRDIALYRTALSPLQIKQCYNGWYPKASLEIFSPCFDPEFKLGFRIANLAPTGASFKINGSADMISKDVS